MTTSVFSRARRRTASAVCLSVLGVGATLAGTGSLSAAAGPPTLQQAFDNVGITASGGAAAGNFDGIGDSFSAGALSSDGLSPGGQLLHDGLSLVWPNVAPGAKDNVVANGQQLAVAGRGNTLGIVAASAYASSGPAGGTFTVDYTNGTSTTGTVSFADWVDTSASTGTDLLASTAGWNPGGTVPVSLSYGSIPLNPSLAVSSVTLPTLTSAGAGTVGSGVTALHVFDLTVGTTASQASGAPGSASYYDEARKDCVGTAGDTASKAWFTVANGVLSDVYAPTIDNTDVKSLEPIVTGTGFTALQERDMTYTVSELGGTGLACRIVALDSARHFAIVTDYVTDPATEAVVMQESLVRLPGAPTKLSVYLRFNPLLNGHGGGGSGNAGGESATVVQTRRGALPLSYSTNSLTEATNRTYAQPIYAALAASTPFKAVENGFVGTSSDGLNELDASQSLTPGTPDANDGNVAQTVELTFGDRHNGQFGPSSLGDRSLGAYAGTTATASSSSCGTLTAASAHGTSSPANLPSADLSSVTPSGIAEAAASAAGLSDRLGPNAVDSVTVALGLSSSENGAVAGALDASAVPFALTYAEFQAQWIAYDARLCQAPTTLPGANVTLDAKTSQSYWLSANVIKASEDKTFLGATVASLASPWGQSVAAGQPASDGLAPYFGSYREVFPRDAYETFTGFLVDGDLTTARQMVTYLFDDLQLASGAFPRNGLLNGAAAPDTGGLQLDEAAYPILAAWQAGLAGNATLYEEHIKPAADFLVANGPADGVERWEEQSGFSPSTIAAEVAGLVSAADIAQVQGDTASARVFLATADDYRRLALETTITSDGPLSASPYFIRLSKNGDPNSAYDYTLGNGDPTSYDQRSVIDQGFLELVRLGELPASNPVVANSVAVAASTIDSTTPSGTGVLRYNGDGYGDCEVSVFDDCAANGEPWATTDEGTGHPWPVLSGENGEYQLAAGDTSAAESDLSFMESSASGFGLVPEQVWNYADVPASPYGSDPTTASIGFVDGEPDGSAAPLTWAQAGELRLIRDLATGKVLEQPANVAARYESGAPASAPLSVTAPVAVDGGNVPTDLTRPSATVNAATTTVTGTTTPGATVDITVSGTASGASSPATTITTLTADGSGDFNEVVTLDPGTNEIEVAATTSGGATSEALLSVSDAYVPGTVVLDSPPAPGGGSGPGTDAYPTATNGTTPVFAPGSFRLGGLSVIDSGATVSFQVGIANLQSTFGSLDGAQLIDLYVHSPTPGTQVQSTAAAGGPGWNYTISPADAWNQLIQVDGFNSPSWVTPATTSSSLTGSSSLGTPQVSVTQLSATTPGGPNPGIVTITVPTAVLGAPTSGWTFTVTLTGQDGFGNNDARTFTATPQAYNFGVCSSAVASEPTPPAICSVDPSLVPLVMDTIPPTSVSVTNELDPLNGPVVLEGATVP